MRKIKFRAWDNNKKKMVYSDDGNQEYGWFTGNDGCMICVRIEEEKDVKLNNIMQYTDVEDKNNKGIYEGDIIYIKDRYSSYNDIVIYENGFFKLDDEEDETLHSAVSFWDGEVVGNIYENKELLK